MFAVYKPVLQLWQIFAVLPYTIRSTTAATTDHCDGHDDDDDDREESGNYKFVDSRLLRAYNYSAGVIVFVIGLSEMLNKSCLVFIIKQSEIIQQQTNNNTTNDSYWLKMIERFELLIFLSITLVSIMESSLMSDKFLQLMKIHHGNVQTLGGDLNSSAANHPSCYDSVMCVVFYSVLTPILFFQASPFHLRETNNFLIIFGHCYLVTIELQYLTILSSIRRNFVSFNEILKIYLASLSRKTVVVSSTSLTPPATLYYTVLECLPRELRQYSPGVSLTSAPLTSMNLSKFIKLHFKINQCSAYVNDIYRFRLCAVILCIFYKIMFLPYELAVYFIASRMQHLTRKLAYVFLLLFYMIQLLFVINSCTDVNNEGQKCKLVLHEHLKSNLCYNEIREIDRYMMHVNVHHVKFELLNCIQLNRSFIVSMFGTIITLLVIFIQFQGSVIA